MASTFNFNLTALPNVKLIVGKDGKEGLWIPLESNFLFKNDKGQVSSSGWINTPKSPVANVSHFGAMRLPKEVAAAMKAETPPRYPSTTLVLNIEGSSHQYAPPQQEACEPPTGDDLPF